MVIFGSLSHTRILLRLSILQKVKDICVSAKMIELVINQEELTSKRTYNLLWEYKKPREECLGHRRCLAIVSSLKSRRLKYILLLLGVSFVEDVLSILT